MMGTFPLLSALPLWLCFGHAAALREPEICYVLDSVLFLYGVILTVLYCRMRYHNHLVAIGEIEAPKPQGQSKKQKGEEEGVYTGLKGHHDTYETIGQKKGLK